MKLYILQSQVDDYDTSEETHGVFSTLELAQQYLQDNFSFIDDGGCRGNDGERVFDYTGYKGIANCDECGRVYLGDIEYPYYIYSSIITIREMFLDQGEEIDS